jgi:hypothetical protein
MWNWRVLRFVDNKEISKVAGSINAPNVSILLIGSTYSESLTTLTVFSLSDFNYWMSVKYLIVFLVSISLIFFFFDGKGFELRASCLRQALEPLHYLCLYL